jgi:hypothetical protein
MAMRHQELASCQSYQELKVEGKAQSLCCPYARGEVYDS